jgi:hypothetical protein
MRGVAIAVFALLVTADQSALAESCGKGMLWPYVRNPGDCLTDAEIAAGARGVYNGPVNTNPNIGALQSPPPAAPAPAPLAAPAAAPAPAPSPAITANGAAIGAAPAVSPVTASGQPIAAPAAQAVYAPLPGPTVVTGANCTKGALWPFVKRPGDCQTGAEKKPHTGGVFCTYQKPGDCQTVPEKPVGVVTGYGAVGAVATAQAASRATSETGAPSPVEGTVLVTPVGQPLDAAAVPNCTKGTLWPFVRKPGDCPTSAEQKRSKSPQ